MLLQSLTGLATLAISNCIMAHVGQDERHESSRQAPQVPGFTLPDAVTSCSHSHVADSKDNAGNHQQHAVPRFDRVGQGVGIPIRGLLQICRWSVCQLGQVSGCCAMWYTAVYACILGGKMAFASDCK